MKRSIVAVAALAACASAAAQVPASLTIYGGVDGNVTRLTSGSKGSQWQMRDGGMYVTKLGFTGSEDLGGGYRAHFIMESQSSSDTGAAATTNTTNSTNGNTTLGGLTWNRKVTVSLFTPVGEARLGRDYTSTFVPATYFDPFFSAGVSAATNFQVFYTSTIALPTLVRASNMIGYYIPSTWVPGMYAYAQVALGEGTGSRYDGLGAGYRTGPLFMSAAIGKTKAPFKGNTVPAQVNAATAADDNNLHVWSAGASYDFSGFKVMGFYHSQKLDKFGSIAGGPTETDRMVDDWLLGFSWAIGVNTIKAAYMVRNDKGLSDNDPRQIGLGYSYNFSKRTAAYANFVNIKNKANGSYNFLASGFAPPVGETGRAIQVGLSHNF
ncbi:MAG: porin [Cytophagales bacterium]|nr:porin [Rhizobacter sp.]